MDFLAIAGWAFGAIAALGALGAAYVRVRSDADNATAEIWKGEAEAQKARADRLETQLAELTSRVLRLESEREMLISMATGTAAIADLRALVVQQHDELKALLP
ncbi:hypothetical protein ACWD3J_15415 [Streptomyces sp. NPDC002755]